MAIHSFILHAHTALISALMKLYRQHKRFTQPPQNRDWLVVPLITFKLLHFFLRGKLKRFNWRTSSSDIPVVSHPRLLSTSAIDFIDLKGYGNLLWVREAKLYKRTRKVKSFLVSSQSSIMQEKSGQCHARFPPASCLTHLALINSWLTGTERFFFFLACATGGGVDMN